MEEMGLAINRMTYDTVRSCKVERRQHSSDVGSPVFFCMLAMVVASKTKSGERISGFSERMGIQVFASKGAFSTITILANRSLNVYA